MRNLIAKHHDIFGKQFLALVFAVILLSSFGILSANPNAFATSYTIQKTKSGLVASDPLDNQTETMQQVLSDTRYWTYYGTAVSEKNTAYDIYKDSQGLHIGEPGPDPAQFGDGSYSGYYAVSPDTNAVLVHAILTATNQPVLHNDFQNQLEIMTTSGQVNYLDCAAITNSDGTYWTLVHGYGDAVEASHFDTLWVDSSPNQPLTRECTVITNGANYLKLYMDGTMVYSSNTLALNMPAPFDYYLQTMNSYYNQMRHGTFKDYYATTDEKITISGNPSNAATVSLVDSTGQSLASSSVTAGTATLDVGKYHFPISGTIQVKDSSGGIIASSAENIYGGDAFAVATSSGTPTVPQPPTNLAATSASQSQINLSWNAPSDNGGSAITGYQIERSTDAGSTWNVLVSNTGSGSTAYSDTGLTANTSYAYRVSAINSVGTSSQSNVSSATTGVASTVPQSPTGLGATATSSSQINLSWSAPADNGGSQITGYQIERSQDNGNTWSDVVSNTGSVSTTYSDTGLSPSTTYTYRVSAINSVGTSSPSNTASATTDIQTSVPQPPTGLTATSVSSSTINLSWNAPGNDGGSPITGYKIERSTNGGSWSVIVSNTGGQSTTYSNSGLLPLMTYSYRVSAINSVGISSPSNTASSTTHLIGPTPIPGGLVISLGSLASHLS